MRHAPVLGGRVAEEPALDVVVHASSGHLLQGVHRHPAQVLVTADLCLLEQQRERIGLRKFRRRPEAAVLGVVRGPHGVENRIDLRRVHVAGAARRGRTRALAALEHLGRDLGPMRAVVGRDAPERAGHLLGWQVRGAREDVARRGEERGRRPAAHVVALVDVRPDVVVDADRHVLVLDHVDDALVRVGGLVHDVTPVAPHRGDGEKDRPVEDARLVERSLRPGAPADLACAVRPGREMELGGAHVPSVRMGL